MFYEVVCRKCCKNVGKSKKLSKYWKQAIPVIVANSIIWVLIGFWHGASWHHVFWGIYNGVLIISSFMFQNGFAFLNKVLHIRTEALDFKIFQRIRTFTLFAIGELFFTADTFTESLQIARRIITNPGIGSSISSIKDYFGNYVLDSVVAVVAVIVLRIVDILQYNHVEIGKGILKQHLITRWAIYLIAIFSIILFGIYGLNNAAAFIYMGI